MEVHSLENVLTAHPFVEGMKPEHISKIVGCTKNVTFEVGEYLARAGQEAGHFYLIREGNVALEFYRPQLGGTRVHSMSGGDLLGWSWMVHPYTWRLDAKALEPVRALVLDGKCLRKKCEDDFEFGYRILQRLTHVMEKELRDARFQLLDVYKPIEAST